MSVEAPARSPAGLRCLALMAGGWVGPERLARAVGELLEGEPALQPDAAVVLTVLEHAARDAGALAPARRIGLVQQRLAAVGAVLHTAGEPGYPERLGWAWPDLGAPLWLALRAPGGRLPDGPAVALVGTRHPTLEGLRTAEELARTLARAGIVVVSGMAQGIDQAAHRGALGAGGRTVAVLGAGFDVDYPRGSAALREEVASSGGLATELAPDAPPRPSHFLARNRIISGLSDAVVVVEGRQRSGALATARLAAAQGRDVWAVPGPLLAPTSQAALALIRDGAQVVTALSDVPEAVLGVAAAQAGPPARAEEAAGAGPDRAWGLSHTAATVLPLLGATPASADDLASVSGLALPAVLAACTELSARGLAAPTPRGLVRLT